MEDSSELYRVYSELKKGNTFDSVLTDLNNNVKQEPIKISFGDMEEDFIEDTLYNLNLNEFSSPLKTNSGWFIFKLSEKVRNSNTGKTLTGHVKRMIEERKAGKIGKEFLKSKLAGIKIIPDKELFLLLSEKVFSKLVNKYKENTTSETRYLTEGDFINILNELGNEITDRVFIKQDDINLTIKNFIYHLMLEEFAVKKIDRSNINNLLSRKLKFFIEGELIANEGYKRGLQNLPEVKEELKLWRENILARLLRNQFIGSINISEDELRDYFNSKYKAESEVTKVNIIEILTGDLNIIQLVLDELKNGKDFKELASDFTEREWTKNKGGEFGLFPVTMHGKIGEAAAQMEVGEIFGPIKLEEGYSLFKLIERKDVSTPPANNFFEVKEQLRMDLKSKKVRDVFNNYTIKLANKYNLKVYKDLLLKTKVTSINMFTFKFIGFGGRMTAVPFTDPLYEWFNIREKESDIIP
jgi:peptidyl-prolyl cis-trans isomerase C